MRSNSNPRFAVGYIRVSTDKQDLGPEAQMHAISSWAKSHGVSLLGWHEDRDVSGDVDHLRRPGLMAALAQVREDRAGLLIIAKRDRLARDPVVAGLTEMKFKSVHCRIVAADGIANGDDATSKFIRNIQDATAAYEKELIRQRTRDALAVKRSKGQRVGTVPLGFTTSADGKTLVPHNSERELISLVQQLKATGMSLGAIARKLNEDGYRTRVGGEFSHKQVARLLTAASSLSQQSSQSCH